jgi:hypothetical protein
MKLDFARTTQEASFYVNLNFSGALWFFKDIVALTPPPPHHPPPHS